MEQSLNAVASILKTSVDDVVPALERLFDRQRDVEKEIASLRQAQLTQFAKELDAASTGDVVVARVDGYAGEQLRSLAQDLAASRPTRGGASGRERRQSLLGRGDRRVARRRRDGEVAGRSRGRRWGRISATRSGRWP